MFHLLLISHTIRRGDVAVRLGADRSLSFGGRFITPSIPILSAFLANPALASLSLRSTQRRIGWPSPKVEDLKASLEKHQGSLLEGLSSFISITDRGLWLGPGCWLEADGGKRARGRERRLRRREATVGLQSPHQAQGSLSNEESELTPSPWSRPQASPQFHSAMTYPGSHWFLLLWDGVSPPKDPLRTPGGSRVNSIRVQSQGFVRITGPSEGKNPDWSFKEVRTVGAQTICPAESRTRECP